MKIPTVQEMRNADAETIRSGLYSGFALMTSAGNAAAEEIIRRTRTSNRIYHILTGSGNNGGDGFIIAANLIRTFGKKRVVLHRAAPPEKLTGDASEAFRALPSDRLEQNDLNAEDLDPEQDLVIDCLLGTGFKGEVREPLKNWIALINASKCPVISIDVPSGLDGDSGSGDPILADLTLTLAAPKPGLLTGNGPAACGLLKVLSIGIPDSILEQVSPGGITGIDTPYFRSLLRRLDPMTYKQKRGHVLIIGGSSA